MKRTTLFLVCALAVGWFAPSRAVAGPDPGSIVVDTLVVRPACLAVTIFTSAFFVISLPVAAVSKSIRSSADTLVVKPAQATFTRPLGDLDALLEY